MMRGRMPALLFGALCAPQILRAAERSRADRMSALYMITMPQTGKRPRHTGESAPADRMSALYSSSNTTSPSNSVITVFTDGMSSSFSKMFLLNTLISASLPASRVPSLSSMRIM